MATKFLRLSVLSLFLAVLALPAWAKQLATSFTLDRPATIAGTQLEPGDYRMVFDPDTQKLQVERDGHVVAEPPAKWQATSYKIPQSAVVFKKRSIKEIQYSGQMGVVKVQK